MSEQTWQAARLIPVSGLGGQEEKERRAASALLAVLGAVKEFGRAVLQKIGAPPGTVVTYCEVPFELADGRHARVDGLIQVKRGKRTWTMLVEVKAGTVELSQHQIEMYLDVAREQGFDGLLTISNQIVPRVEQHPVRVEKKKIGRLQLAHISWTRLLALAQLIRDHQGVSDPDQAWILGELIRYLEFEGSGALRFDDMGPNWVAVRSAAAQETLRMSDRGVEEVAGRWDQLVQYLCLGLQARLGEEVRPVLTRQELDDPGARTRALARELVDTGSLSAIVKIPNTAGPVRLRALLRRMIAQASIEIDAPDLKRATARVNWLLRQLHNAPADLRIDVAFPYTSATASDLLPVATASPKRLLIPGDKVPKSFVLTLSQSVGGKRKLGRNGFIGDVSALLDRFYREVVQDIRPWTPPAPQLSPAVDDHVPPEEKLATEPIEASSPTSATVPTETTESDSDALY